MSRLSVGRALRAPRVLTRLRSLLARPFGAALSRRSPPAGGPCGAALSRRSPPAGGPFGVALSRPRRRPTVTVYTRTNCGLCRRAEAVVVRVARGRADVELVDVDSDPELVARYTVRVPVVAIDGRELFEYEVDPRALRAALHGADRADPR